ncbi:MAG: response regulator [Anaerolineae bacterium]|nr:response regulator [Anaerolineae bacterium]
MAEKKNILIVDDNEQNLYLLQVLLEGNGYRSLQAKSGNEALEIAIANPPDLVISDILMPGMDGFALCRQWKSNEILKSIPFIFYTATYTDLKDEEFSLSLGAARFIRKPAEPSRFIEIIRDVLEEYQRGVLVKSVDNLNGEEVFLKKYNEALIRKMEDKLLELEKTNQKLSEMVQTSKELTYRIEAGLRAGNLAWWEMQLPSGRVSFDKRKVDLIGFPPEMFQTYEDFTRLLHPDDYPKAMQAMRDHLEGRAETYEVEYRIKTVSGSYKWFRDVGAITEKDEKNEAARVIGIVEDITKRKEAELELEKYSNHLEELVAERSRELEKAHKELLAKEKLATLGQLAGSVGHELRNPLGVISNAIYILKSSVSGENEKTKEYIDLISSQVKRSNKIITDLLNFAKEPMLDKSKTSVAELIKASLEQCPPPENVQVEVTGIDEIGKINVDQNQIMQAVINILGNAYQALPQGGRVKINCTQSKKEAHISIADNGTGISASDKRKLFTPLFTTKARGIGLGLAVSKKFIEANGGKIKVASTPGKGSTFTIILPLSLNDE